MSTPDLEAALDVVLQSTRSHMWSRDHTKVVSSDITGTEAARDFLKDRPLMRPHLLRILEIHATRDAFIQVQTELLLRLTYFDHQRGKSTRFLFHDIMKNESSTGAQLKSNGMDLVVETPWDSRPYMYLGLIKTGRWSEADQSWAGIIVHDSQFFKIENFWPAKYAERQNRRDSGHALLIGWLAEQYIERLHDDGKELETRIETLKMPAQNGQIKALSKSILKLNECIREVHTLQLDLRTSFSLEFANWTSDSLKTAKFDSDAQRLLSLASKHSESPSGQLRDKIAETRAEITDLAAQQRQEQDEIQRARAYQLQELSIKIAEDSRRDSRTMRGIAWVTMAFLPATFVTSFFGMNFFDGIADGRVFDGTSRNIWVFFVIALPISAMVLVIFWWWDRKTQVLERVKREAREKALAS